MGIIKRGKSAEPALDDLESQMADALGESMIDLDAPPAETGRPDVPAQELDGEEAGHERSLPVAEWHEPESIDEAGPVQKLTSHTQNRLAALNAFEKIYNSAEEQIGVVNARLASITTFHHSIREVISILHGEIHRANELELANTTVLMEHRKLYEQFQESTRKHQERESLLERLQSRETSLLQDNEALRVELAAVKLELVETSNTVARQDAELADLQNTLSARSAENDRRARENEALREKYVQLSLDLDKAQKREAETRHRLDELSTIHANETARHSELLNTLAASEKETLRLQKALDFAQSKQADLLERAKLVDNERLAEAARGEAELRGLRSEIQALHARLDSALHDGSQTATELAEVRMKLSDAETERQVLQEKLAVLARESEADRNSLIAANANLSELTLHRASEQIELDVRIQECEDLRAEIASLNAQIKELLPYERLHRVTKAREGNGRVVDFASAAAGPGRPGGRRPNGTGRRRNA